MRVVYGNSALSKFRTDKILQALQARHPACVGVQATWLYFLNLECSLDLNQENTVADLLNLKDAPRENSVTASYPLQNKNALTASPGCKFPVCKFVVPRIGTISPWSSKATEIFHLCGLNKITRIERGVFWQIEFAADDIAAEIEINNSHLCGIIYDPMTESILDHADDELALLALFASARPAPLQVIELLQGGAAALAQANLRCGFALSQPEQAYLIAKFTELARNPTDVELMMFAQVNSEHCRHKIFNADWEIDGISRSASLFSLIRTTHANSPAGTLSAYSDNAAVLEGESAARLTPHPESKIYGYIEEPIHYTAKVETHNHPTAISPFSGASTGSGGEIRDEGATGRGGKPKAGLVGFSVSHLRLPALAQPWERAESRPHTQASPLQIMLEAPIGAAAFNNEFGRANIAGYFRNFEYRPSATSRMSYGYHKPIMLSGGVGNVRPAHVEKHKITAGTPIVVLGGPTMLIGLGGGAASSVSSGSSHESLDFASVQRGNPEMQRRCQEVIDGCCAMGDENPIVSIHDVGAGGLCNALPELVYDAGVGGRFELREVLNDEPGMSPMQIWCNESQERYVLAIKPCALSAFKALCARERCLFAVVGSATKNHELILNDEYFRTIEGATAPQKPIDLPMDVLFGLPPKMFRQASTLPRNLNAAQTDFARFDYAALNIDEALDRVLAFPAVADKTFLVTIADRSVGGLIARDQMIGPWQVPVADVAVTSAGFCTNQGEAFAIGERAPVAVLDAPASGRMAIGEAITNLSAASILDLRRVRLSANWMVAAGEPGHDADLYETVRSVSEDVCRPLGVSIPVGKDSMSMKTVWREEGVDSGVDSPVDSPVDSSVELCVVAPISVVITAFSAVDDVGRTLTPYLQSVGGCQSELWLIDLGGGKNRMGASVLVQSMAQIGDVPADLVSVDWLSRFFNLIQELNRAGIVKAYHDRSDGGLITTLYEMAFASRCGLEIVLDGLLDNLLDDSQTTHGGLNAAAIAVLFNEELGAVLQVNRQDRSAFLAHVAAAGLGNITHFIGAPVESNRVTIAYKNQMMSDRERTDCHRKYSATTWQMQRTRDHPECADMEYRRILERCDPGLHCNLSFDLTQAEAEAKAHKKAFAAAHVNLPQLNLRKPRIAILREQGVNGQHEMAAAFDAVGFEAVDVTTTDLIGGQDLHDFQGIAACGGFSFGDVLGAGEGWGKSILFNAALKDKFQRFFYRTDTFALGVCNGCQMLSSIKEIIPGAQSWPRFRKNRSEQYEARFVMVEVQASQSILFQDMQGSRFAVSTAHAEGRAEFAGEFNAEFPAEFPAATNKNSPSMVKQVCLKYLDNHGVVTETYPLNPSGSPHGVTGFTNADGRFTIMMPHPERVFRTNANSWHPQEWGEYSPWIKLFLNARNWVK